MDFTVISSNKGGECLIFDNYKYRKFRTQKKTGSIVWRCYFNKCNATLTTDAENSVIVGKNAADHGHESVSSRVLERQELRGICKRKAIENTFSQPLKIIRKELKSIQSNEIAMSDVSTVRKSMYRERRKLLPSEPKNIQEALTAVCEVKTKTNNGEDFTFVDVQSEIVVITCKSNLNFLIKNCGEYLADGTFTYCPKYFYQQYTIHGHSRGYYFPLVTCLLPSKSEDCYLRMWPFLKRICLEETGMNLNPSLLVLDFEVAAHSAVMTVFPSIKIKGCRFHLGQAWWRKIQSIPRLQCAYKDKRSDVGKWLKYFFGMPLLSAEEVPEAFVNLFGISPGQTECTEFSDYILGNYIESEVFPPSIWAETPSSSCRTTNGAENYHRQLSSEFSMPHPNIFKTIDVLKNIQNTTELKIREHNKGGMKIKRNVDREREDFIQTAFSRYQFGEIDQLEYLKLIGYRLQGFKLQ